MSVRTSDSHEDDRRAEFVVVNDNKPAGEPFHWISKLAMKAIRTSDLSSAQQRNAILLLNALTLTASEDKASVEPQFQSRSSFPASRANTLLKGL